MSDYSEFDPMKKRPFRISAGSRKSITAVICILLAAAGLLAFLLIQNHSRKKSLNLPASEWDAMKQEAFSVLMDDHTYRMTESFYKCWAINPLNDGMLHIITFHAEGEQYNDLKIMLADEKQNILQSVVIPGGKQITKTHWNISKGCQYLVYQFLGDPVYEQEISIELILDGEGGFNPGG